MSVGGDFGYDFHFSDINLSENNNNIFVEQFSSKTYCASESNNASRAGQNQNQCYLVQQHTNRNKMHNHLRHGHPKRRGRPVIPNNAARERSRVKTLRTAFLDLQRTLPAVPPDTKLSKLDVLVLATTYIAHLMSALQDDVDVSQIFAANGCMHPVKKWPMRTRLYAGILSSTLPHGPEMTYNTQEMTSTDMLYNSQDLTSYQWSPESYHNSVSPNQVTGI